MNRVSSLSTLTFTAPFPENGTDSGSVVNEADGKILPIVLCFFMI